jgi:hypothetical protein
MKLKKKIYEDIEQLPPENLGPLYNYVNSLKYPQRRGIESAPSLEEVHKALSSSKKNWSDDVIKEREERV